MKEARNYIDTLSRGLKAWDYWVHNGNTIISDTGVEMFLYFIKSDTDELCNLDANEVKDVILESEDGISFRLRRINEYGLLPLLQKLEDSKDIKSSLIDDAVNEAINTYFLRIYEKANDLCRIISECEKYLQPKKTKKEKKESNFRDIIQYPDKERLLKRLHELIDGKKGADVGSVLFKATEDKLLTRVPYQAEYESEFTLIGCWSAIHNYMVFDPNDNNKLTRAFNIEIFD